MSENIPETEKFMTKEQEELLESLETEFKDRYTEADKEFKLVWETDLPPPPIFEDWEPRYDIKSNPIHRRGYKHYSNYRQRRYDRRDGKPY